MFRTLLLVIIIVGWETSFGQSSIPQIKHRLLLADEGNGKVHYVNLHDPTEKWSSSCSNRDMQLVGNDRLMVSDNGGKGYSELDILTGKVLQHTNVSGVTSGVNSSFRQSHQEIFCAIDGSPAKIHAIDSTGRILSSITLSLDASVRICRPTPKGTFIIGGKIAGMVYEFDSSGKKIWECNAGGEPYMGLRLPNGTTLISNGYGGQMVLADQEGKLLKKFPTDTDKKADASFWNEAKPNFFAGFQVLRNGNIIVSNWQGHGAGHGSSGFQLIEIDSTLSKVVAYWKQDASIVSSLHGVLVLDSLDTKLLYSDCNGALQPISDPLAIPITRTNTATPVLNAYNNPLVHFDLMGRLVSAHMSNNCIIQTNGKIVAHRRIVLDSR